MEKEKLNKILAKADLEYEQLKDRARESSEWRNKYFDEKLKNEKIKNYVEYILWNYFNERSTYLKVRDELLNILEKK